MNLPHVIEAENIKIAYCNAIEFLSLNHWEYFNLIVQISEPDAYKLVDLKEFTDFYQSIASISPKIVASTIFPEGMYQAVNSRDELYNKYETRLFPKARRGRWGTYFERMINYEQNSTSVNQLENIITKINSRSTDQKAAYTIYIQYPGSETTRKMGAPCLNYLAIQIKSGRIGVLAVYRNHDFLTRAFGNYLGLCNLIKFISLETSNEIGMLTCISSHAFVGNRKHELYEFCNTLSNEMA
jgi:thymidylate synthase